MDGDVAPLREHRRGVPTARGTARARRGARRHRPRPRPLSRGRRRPAGGDAVESPRVTGWIRGRAPHVRGPPREPGPVLHLHHRTHPDRQRRRAGRPAPFVHARGRAPAGPPGRPHRTGGAGTSEPDHPHRARERPTGPWRPRRPSGSTACGYRLSSLLSWLRARPDCASPCRPRTAPSTSPRCSTRWPRCPRRRVPPAPGTPAPVTPTPGPPRRTDRSRPSAHRSPSPRRTPLTDPGGTGSTPQMSLTSAQRRGGTRTILPSLPPWAKRS